MKRFFRCKVCNDVHFGDTPPEICPTCESMNSYVEVTKDEAERYIADSRRYFRCASCDDIHCGSTQPEMCPTCENTDSHVEVTKDEAEEYLGS